MFHPGTRYLGYTYKNIGDNRRVLYDQVSIINDRCNYLRKIKSFREAGYDIDIEAKWGRGKWQILILKQGRGGGIYF
jgi:hypothetical protein